MKDVGAMHVFLPASTTNLQPLAVKGLSGGRRAAIQDMRVDHRLLDHVADARLLRHYLEFRKRQTCVTFTPLTMESERTRT
jgi:hypothetical protein